MGQGCAVAVWEPQPYWGPELQRQLGALGVRVFRWDGHSMIRSVEVGQVVVTVAERGLVPLAELRDWVAEGIRVHLVLDSSLEDLRWFLYELGATSVFDFGEARRGLALAVDQIFTNKVV